MTKRLAIELLGGTTAAAAAEVGVTFHAVDDWPDVLSRRIEDRVIAALARKHPSRRMAQILRRIEQEAATAGAGAAN